MKKLLMLLFLLCDYACGVPFFDQDTVALALGTVIPTISTALVYEIGKRNWIPPLTDYLKKGEFAMKISFGVKSHPKTHEPIILKVGFDAVLWNGLLALSAVVWKLLPRFEKNKGMWCFGTIFGSVVIISIWAQTVPERYNPFIWKNADGSNDPVLIWSKYKYKTVIMAGGSCYYKRAIIKEKN